MFSDGHFMLGDANDKNYCTLLTYIDLGKISASWRKLKFYRFSWNESAQLFQRI